MKAMVFYGTDRTLKLEDSPMPTPEPTQLLIRVRACGVCRTDLHIVDGDLKEPKLPLIPGHEIVGVVEKIGSEVRQFQIGDRVGIPWMGYTCHKCRYCLKGQENLCNKARFTGYHIDGGYAQYTVAEESCCFSLPACYSDMEAAPFLCAGLIGYRSYVFAGDGEKLGLYGFGAAAHILAQIAVHDGKKVFVFTRPGDEERQNFALNLGVHWAGGSLSPPPEELDAAIIFAPAGGLLPQALKNVAKGGVVVCGGIHMSDIPSFPYRILWGEKTVRSVANLTRRDGIEFLKLASQFTIRLEINQVPLEEANEALDSVRKGKINGAAVLTVP